MLTELDMQFCIRCGLCKTICPMFTREKGWDHTTPRGRAILALGLRRGEVEINDELIRAFYQCPTCMQCETSCPAGAKVTEMIRETRAALAEAGVSVPFSHKGVFDIVARMTSKEGLTRDWQDLIKGDFQEKGETVYFPGCLPYVEPLLDFDIGAERIMSGAVRILNRAGIKPAIPQNLACCGHDAFWSGEYSLFYALREKNSQILKEAKVIVTSCAEGYRTLKNEYSLEAEVYHMSQFVRDLIKAGKLELKKGEERITFHDPCRLGRHMGEYDAPREVLKSIADYREMSRARSDAVCCGVGAWMNCNECSKEIRVDRVREAAEVADILVTACTKCLSHFRCLIEEPNKMEDLPDIKIMDFTEFVSRYLKEG
jgi:heterodisulfide reductase subunit D